MSTTVKTEIKNEKPKIGKKLIFKFYRTIENNTIKHECKLNGLYEMDVEYLFAQVNEIRKQMKRNK